MFRWFRSFWTVWVWWTSSNLMRNKEEGDDYYMKSHVLIEENVVKHFYDAIQNCEKQTENLGGKYLLS